MRFVLVEDKYGQLYTRVQMWDKEVRKVKGYDFLHCKDGDEKCLMSPFTGEILPKDRQVIIDHILEMTSQYPELTPINREI